MKGPIAAAALVLALLSASCSGGSSAPGVQVRTGKVERGEVVEGVAASGTVQPVVLVQVGTQISGVVEKLMADFNSKVTAGQVIALLDSRRLASQVAGDEAALARARAETDRSRAALVQAKAEVGRVRTQVAQAGAEVDRAQALRVQAAKNLERQKALVARRLSAPADLDAAEANLGSLDAQVAAARASVAQAEAQVAVTDSSVVQGEAQIAVAEAAAKQAEAQLASDRVNLAYATITSPVDGVVVSRNVDVGQTVAASLQAPTLFVIAQDLTKVQVQTSVPEADVGRLKVGQETRFTVDAHPDRAFRGAVTQVRLASTTVQNVVTYTVIVEASNPDGLLFPGMTADVTFEIARSPADALRVPASALRLQPPADMVDGGSPAPAPAPAKGGRTRPRPVVYLALPGNRLRPVAVRPGISDGAWTAVEPAEAGALKEGTEVVTAVVKEAEATTTNPFAPPRMGGRPSGGR